MRILLTGANGYIGQRLLPALVEQGHHVICSVRDPQRFSPPSSLSDHISVIGVDFNDGAGAKHIPLDIDVAFYLMHSMSSTSQFKAMEARVAHTFRSAIEQTECSQVIYLSGMVNDDSLSEHLASRKAVEDILAQSRVPLTTLRAGIIIGSGSASFEIIRDLVEKLPVMITPKWLNTRCQPIGIYDVISFLSQSMMVEETFDRSFDIGGPDVLSYKEMLLGYAQARGLKRYIRIVPVMTPRISSYWLYFVTSTSYKLATSLVDSMKVEVVCRNTSLNAILHIDPMPYLKALGRTLQKVDENQVISSWTDSLVSGRLKRQLSDFLNVPTHGCFVDQRHRDIWDKETTLDRIWRIGGRTGWYKGDFLWRIRGFMDKLAGGVGLRRGRTHDDLLHAGDTLDFWRVLYADRSEGRLLLFAEMRLPGEAWLEFKTENGLLTQTATFRPKGLMGRLYWMAVFPFHGYIFNGMIDALSKKSL